MDRVIIHFDMDMFFAAVEILDNPNLRGKPLCVSPPPPARGVITTASYEARVYGLHSGMPITTAASLCPDALFISPNMEKYENANLKIREIVSKYSDRIEFVALDEAYLDVTFTYHLFGDVKSMALSIQRDIYVNLGLTCSVGIGYCKIAAKLASERNKPNGFGMILNEEEFLLYVKNLKLSKINGIGEKLAVKIENYFGKKTLGELLEVSLYDFTFYFGKNGTELYNMIRGIDNREVLNYGKREGYGSRRTFQNNITGYDEVMKRILWNIKTVSWELKRDKKIAYTVTLIIRFSTFKRISKSKTIKNGVSEPLEIYNIVKELASEVDLQCEIRQIGVRLSKTTNKSTYYQLALGEENSYLKRKKIDTLVYSMQQQFGRKVIGDFIDSRR